jgi:hypothetical protein
MRAWASWTRTHNEPEVNLQDPTTDIGSYEAQNVEDLWNERFPLGKDGAAQPSEKPANRHVVTVAKVAKCCWRGTRVVPGMVAFLLLVGVAYAGES